MATATMLPDGDGTHVGVVGEIDNGGSGPYYTNVDEGTTTPDDANAILFSSNPSSIFLTLTATPVDCSVVTAVTIKIRTVNASKGNAVSSCQIFKSDESTALTASATISGTTTATTYTLNPSITGDTDKTSWDGARIKINASGGSGIAVCYALQVDITYTAGGGSSGGQNRMHSIVLDKALSDFNNSMIVPLNLDV